MMQGDSYNEAIRILNNAGNAVTPEDIIDLEICIGQIRKTHLKGELTFYGGWWMVPLTQEETFAIAPGPVKAQARIKWANGVIEGKKILGIRMEESMSKEKL